MLKNMAIHELALLVSFYGVSVETIDKCEADKDFSSCQTLKGPSGETFTDFDKIKFTITTKAGNEVSVQGKIYFVRLFNCGNWKIGSNTGIVLTMITICRSFPSRSLFVL